MITDRDIEKYVIMAGSTVGTAINHVIQNKGRITFVVNDKGILLGLLTNGDILRWIASQDQADLSQDVAGILHDDFLVARPETPADQIDEWLTRVRFVPVIDDHGRLIAVARERTGDEGIQIGDKVISDDSPVFIIAEIGINHNGMFDLATRLVDEAAKTGADCAKFQMRDMGSLYANAGDSSDPKENLGSQYTLDLLSRFQLSTEQMIQLFDRCKERGVQPLCTPWDSESLRVLEEYGMPAYKLASADLTNHALLEEIAKTGKPIIASTGMSTESEITAAVDLLNRAGAQYVLLHCNSTYPAPFKDINLNYLSRLKEIGQCPVGYSGHERGSYVAVASVALGARVIEKHFTLDRSMEGNDHKVSLLPDEFTDMIEHIRNVEMALGHRGERSLSQGEMMNRVTLAKSLVINCDLELGDVIKEEMVEIKSPGRGLQPNRLKDLIGKTAKRGFSAGDFFYPSDLEEDKVKARPYTFNRPWGVPVRYHDFKSILEKSNPDFLEFHLSYKDMDEDLSHYFDETYDLDLVVHSPDSFTGDHLLNLCDEDPDHRKRSIEELQRVVEITKELKPFFGKCETPLIVASVGGYTRDAHIPEEDRAALYDVLAESLAQVDAEGVEIIPQTLPPFPWYFGGQLYLNLFMDAKDTAEFCKKYGYRTCFDICHSKLACNHYNWSFKSFIDELGPYIAHLHISDAKGVDGEGIQVGEGDIDFPALAADLARVSPDASFIPEIWQGHENDGEGFWIALERMEGIF
ncbi:MAG: N-acetylneuraminate synthase family protein [Verrucomicrobiota bacterium]